MKVFRFPIVGWKKQQLGRFPPLIWWPSQVCLDPGKYFNGYFQILATEKFWPAPPLSRTASFVSQSGTKTCKARVSQSTLIKIITGQSNAELIYKWEWRIMLWLCHRHSLRPSMKSKGEIRSSRKRLFNKNICADCNSLNLRRYERWRSDKDIRFKRIMSTMLWCRCCG